MRLLLYVIIFLLGFYILPHVLEYYLTNQYPINEMPLVRGEYDQ